MRLNVILLLLLALSCSCRAFDPGGLPPTKTLSWTTSFANRVTIPKIRYKGETPERAISHLLRATGLPPAYAIAVDATRLQLTDPAIITFDADDLTLMQALARIAEQTQADLLIKPGVVILQPR